MLIEELKRVEALRREGCLIVEEIKAQRALSPTNITIAPYVINPYRGCLFGCHYCYVKRNKAIIKKNMPWGLFVDVKKNLPELLKAELKKNSDIPRVLLGSTTECYQEAESKYQITRQILSLLNDYCIPVTILTKSDLITRDKDVLSKNSKNEICFTISPFDEKIRSHFELGAPARVKRISAIKELKDCGVNVYAHVGPLMPGLFDIKSLTKVLKPIVSRIDFEVFNYNTMDGKLVEQIFESRLPNLYDLFCSVYSSKQDYEIFWNKVCHEVDEYCKDIPHKIHIHPFYDYFANKEGQYVLS